MTRTRPALRLAALMLLAAVGCWSRGSGTRRQHGYDRATPVVAALERYRGDHGAYPDSLTRLVPEYLPASALEIPQASREQYPLEYVADTSGYRLQFRYVGPGMNFCWYSPHRAKWRCGGYF